MTFFASVDHLGSIRCITGERMTLLGCHVLSRSTIEAAARSWWLWTGTLPTRFVLISNELPRFGDSSGASATSFVTLVLSESWLGRENTALTNELLVELSGILSWSLDGLDRLNSRGRFTEPTSSVDAMVALRDLVSPISAFVRDRCEVGPYEVPCDAVWAAWKSWAEENGHRPGSAQALGQKLRAAVPGLRTLPAQGIGHAATPLVRGHQADYGHNGPTRVSSSVTGPDTH
jgi:putative DNA primase/helicase